MARQNVAMTQTLFLTIAGAIGLIMGAVALIHPQALPQAKGVAAPASRRADWFLRL